VITLPCGHAFHWSRDLEIGCEGLYQWTRARHNDCPICRAQFGGIGEDSAATTVLPARALQIDWLTEDGRPPDRDTANLGLPPGR
jgi:hypothetical protein